MNQSMNSSLAGGNTQALSHRVNHLGVAPQLSGELAIESGICNCIRGRRCYVTASRVSLRWVYQVRRELSV